VRSSCESSNNPPAGAAAPTTSTSLMDLDRAAPSLLQAAETEQPPGQLRSCTSDNFNFCFSPLASEQDDVASSQTVSVLDRDESPKMTALVQPAAEGGSTSGDKEVRGMPRQMKEAVCLFIFRRDLRVVDNPALRAAALRYRKVICCFIFTPEQIDPTQNRLYNHRAVKFMMECLTSLRQELLRDYDATLGFFFGDNVEVLEEIYACFQTSPLLAATTRYGDNDHGLLGGTADLRPATSPTHQGEGGGRSNRRHDERLLLGGAPAPTLLEDTNSASPPSNARRGFPFQHHLPLGAIAFNEDYSYYARVRDDRLRAFCKRRGLECLVRENYTLMPRKFFLDPVDDEAFTTQQDFLNFAHTPEVRAVILQECLNGCKDELAQAQEGVEAKSKSSAEIEPDFPPDPVGGGRAAAGGDPETMMLTCSSRAPSSALSASSYEQGLTKKFASGTSLLPMPRKLGKRLRAACGSTTSTGKGKTNIKNKKDSNHHDQQHSDTFQLSARAAFSQLPAYQQGQARFRFLCRLYADRKLFADYLVGGRANAQLLMEYCRSLRYETVDWNEMVGGCTGAASTTRNTTSDSTTAYSGASDAQSRSSRTSSNQSYTPSSSKNNRAPSEQLRSESIAAAGPPPGRQAWQHSTSDSRRFPAREDEENEVVGQSPRSQTLSRDGCARPESDRDENETVAARKNHARLTHPVPTRMLPQLDHPPQERSDEKARASSPQRTIRPTTQEEYEERKLRSRYLRDGHVYDRVLQKRKASLSDYVPGGRGERAERGDESDDRSSKNTLNEEPASDPEGCDKAEQHMREQQKHLYTELVATRQGTQASSMLSPYVKFGCVSLRELFLFFEFAPELAQEVRDSSQNGILIKEFYATIAWYFPALFVRTTLNPVEAYAEAEGRANNRIREEDEDEDELRHAEKDQEGSGATANEDENNVDDKLEHEDRPWHAKGEEEGEEIRIGCRPRNLQTTELDERNHATTVDAPLQHQVEVQQERVFGPKDAIQEHHLQQTEQHRDAAHESSPGPLLTSAAAAAYSNSRSRGSSAEYYSTSQSELVNVISPIVTKTRSKSLPMASTGVPESTYFGSSTAGGPGGEQLSQFDRGAASTGCGGVDEQCLHQRQGGSGPQFMEPPLDPHEGRGPLLCSREWSTDSSSSSKPPAAPPLWTDSMGDDVKRHYQQKTLGPVVFVRSREHKEMLQALYSSTFFDSVRWVLDRHGNNALKAHLPWCAPVVVVTDHRGTTQKVDVFARWCIGATGFPFVDAGMRELNATGFMHYRARLVCANFLTRLLGINWTLGQEWFAKKQIDYDWSVNDGNWHLVTSMAFFAANFTKMVYDPFEQGRLFDPHCAYIKKWLPELAQVPNEVLHHWDHYSASKYMPRPVPGGPGGPGPSTPGAALASNPPAGGEEGDNYAKVVDMIKQVYPQPMISVRMAVKRCIQTYKQAQLKAAWFSPEAELPEDKVCWGEEGRSEDGSSK